MFFCFFFCRSSSTASTKGHTKKNSAHRALLDQAPSVLPGFKQVFFAPKKIEPNFHQTGILFLNYIIIILYYIILYYIIYF